MLGVYLTDPTVKIYVVYNDGSERRIKVGKLIRQMVNRVFLPLYSDQWEF